MTAMTLTPAVARGALRGLGERDSDDEVVDRYARAFWSGLVEPGDGVAGELISRFGPEEALRIVIEFSKNRTVPPGTTEELRKGLDRWTPRVSAGAVSAALHTARTSGVRLVTPADEDWPAPLDDLGTHVPVVLWVRGDIGRVMSRRSAVAIVGARAATSYGEHVAGDLAGDLGGSGTVIVSGAAYGIDGSAHRAALANDAPTVALLAGGVERAYPLGHTRLIDAIAERGVVASEVPCGSTPTKWRFLQRNRLIAALADATVVVEAGWRSGSLNTAGHAASLSRGLGAVPGPITSPASAGCHRLLREYGAQCITGADDVRELLGITAAHPSGRPGDPGPATDDATRVRDALSPRSWRTVDDIARRCGMSRAQVDPHLGLFLLAGEAERGAAGWRSVRPGR